MGENAFPVCFSCSRFYDEKTGEVISQVVREDKRGNRLCKECIEAQEREIWPKG